MDILSQEMLDGKVFVKIYNSTLSGKRVLEGEAKIKKILQGDRQGVHAQIKFIGETECYERWVFANDQ